MWQKSLAGASFILLTISPNSWAGKLGGAAGAYSFQAENNRNDTSSSLSGFGSYQVIYRHSLASKIEFEASYSLVTSEVTGGDLSYGFNVGLNYFLLAPGDPIIASGPGASLQWLAIWNPFIGAGFSQRNFQSTSSQFAGAHIHLGTEFMLNERTSALGVFRYLSLGGPDNAAASQIDILFGFLFHL